MKPQKDGSIAGNATPLDPFTQGYIECALWSSELEDGILAPSTRERMIADCARFQRENAALLAKSSRTNEHNGHDFWLTRNRHGAGFWDRGDFGDSAVGDELTHAAHRYGTTELYVGDDGRVHCV